MRRNQYLKDYKLASKLDPRGRLSQEAVYVGSYYRFSAKAESFLQAKKSYRLLTVPAVLLLFFQLWFTDLFDPNRRFLVLPMSFNVLPAFGVALGVIRLHLVRDRMTSLQHDRICNRLPLFSFLFFLFALLSFFSTLAQVLMSGVELSTFLYCLNALVLMLLTFWIFKLRKILKTEMIFD